MSLSIIEKRSWTYAWGICTYPQRFAGLLAEDGEWDEGLWRQVSEDWNFLLFVERNRHSSSEVNDMYSEIWWAHMQSVQLMFRILASANFEPSSELDHAIGRRFSKIGDTKGHNDVKDMFREHKAFIFKTPQV